MSEVLSQSQIDMLLNSMLSGGSDPGPEPVEEEKQEEYRKYNFYSPKKFNRDKLKILHNVYDNYARMLSSKLNGIFRTNADVQVVGIEEQRYYEFSNALGENDVLGITGVEFVDGKKGASVLMHVSTPLTLAMIDMMIGGGDGSDVNVPFQYKYTDVELSLFEALFVHITKNLGDAWSAFTELRCHFERLEKNPSMVQLIGADETVVIVIVDVQLGATQGKINICIPGSTLSSIFAQYERLLKESQSGLSNSEEEKVIMDALRGTSLEIKVKMGTSKILLGDAYEIKVGDVINLNRPKDSDVFLYIDDKERFTGKLGVHKKNMAVRINRMLDQ
ncbi:MAG: FliM/FliN family flagellar motor switch protein [Peptostreptococcaceae bacterium]|nr:FliM/FliN family flagellar motor switch protein [Peptostreptococcaceae bacterium]